MGGLEGGSGRGSAGSDRGLGLLLAAVLYLAAGPLLAQTGIERPEGLRDNTPRWHALTGARLVLAPGQVVEAGTVVLRDGIVVAAGAGVTVPEGARVWPLAGRTVYSGFIDLAGSVGVPAALRALPPQRPSLGSDEEALPRKPRPEPKPMGMRALSSRNPSVRPEQDVALQLEWNSAEAKLARDLGFTTVLATPSAGVFRGQGAIVSTGDRADARAAVLRQGAAQHLAFEVGRGPDAGYPSSLMGAIALVRQTLLDARWHRAAAARPAAGERLAPNASLAALVPVLEGRQPVILAAEDEQDYARLARVRDEFGLRAVLHGTGHEYRRAAQIRAAGLPVLVPLDFPATPDVANPDAALDVPLASLQHWEQAPSNLALLHRAGVPVAVTAAGLRDARREFWPRLRQAVRRGLPAEQALAALTTVPAGLLGEGARLGTIAPGRIANLVVARGDLFTSEEAAIELLFIDGRPLPTEALENPDPRGSWAVDGGGETLRLAGSAAQPRLEREGDSCELLRRGRAWVLRLSCAKGAAPGADDTVVVAELRGDAWVGTVQRGTGPLQPWSARRVAAALPAAAAASAASVEAAVPGSAASAASAALAAAAADRTVPAPWPSYPAGAFGVTAPERPAAVLVRNATLWTQGPAGRLSGADLLVRDGRVAAVGVGLAAPVGARVIDATGKHVTPGLIDAHSHIAITRGVNEGTNSVTAEVRIADVLDPTDISLYRQLAGGLTAANLMHGSANTIGGQTQVIKLRWGGTAADLVFEGARPGIKFALGENVKRSNWGDARRYPATRMGVEQLLRDGFQAARGYEAEWRDWRAAPGGRPEPRRDLQLETLVQILQRQRAVHIHSYRADEILMFVRLAREFGIDVAAFQHVLEGYKVADAMASIGAGGSTFSDWWGYKMEVVDAVPSNGALMHRAGVLTSFNSDDPELARRMNTEAAKAVKYGGLPEAEALALVTLNPARQLGVDRRTGSLEPGKDADFVIWSASPLSTYARAEQTWIDGSRYFDLEEDRRLRDVAATERARLVTAALRAPRPAAAAAGRTEPQRPSLAQALQDGRSWREVLDAARSHRPAYSGQAAWHECTEDQP